MKVLCISTILSEDQARKIWSQKPQFVEIKDFGVTAGQNYLVYGIAILGGEPWVYILSSSNYLRPVPLCLFEIVDSRVSQHWIVKNNSDGGIEISCPSIINNPYYLDDLSENDLDTVKDFQKIQQILHVEFREYE